MQKLLVVCPIVTFSLLGFGALQQGISSRTSGPGLWVEREAYVMGTSLRIVAFAADKRAGIDAVERALAAVDSVDDQLSTWRDDTELSRLNRAAEDSAVVVSPALFAWLSEVAGWVSETDGAFDPAVGPLIDAWDLRGRGSFPAPSVLARARAQSGWPRFALDRAGGTVVRSAPGWIDSGAFGKGAALRAATEALIRSGVRHALLDFGGQVVTLGGPSNDEPWRVGVAHPTDRDSAVLHLRLTGLSAATTAQSERYREIGGERVGHVLDPRTGRPVPPWGAVTVIAADPMVADILSTALYVMGPDAGLPWVESQGSIGALFLVNRGGTVEIRASALAQALIERSTVVVEGP